MHDTLTSNHGKSSQCLNLLNMMRVII